MLRRLVSFISLCGMFVVFAAGHPATAEDWPMWRHDAGRTAMSQETLPARLHLQWLRQLPTLKPAFRQARLQFDRGYEPIVTGQTLLVALPHNDSLVAYATDTGEEKWRFDADGPIRLAPVAWQGKVYFGCDDGHLYCLNVADGSLRWKFRAVPSSRKVLGNGRLISVWPVRGGPVLVDGTVYFAAGVWPLEGIFVYALDAATGDVVWLNDRTGSLYGVQPHNGQAMGGLTPQGYLLVNGDELIVPCGTARPATFDRHTGQLKDFSLPGAGRHPGGWFAALDPQQARDIRRGKIERGTIEFDSDINRQRHEDVEHTGDGIPGLRSRISLGGKALSYADGFADVRNEYNIASEDSIHGNVVEGDVHTMLAADGRLFVVTLDGHIYCFAAESTEPIVHTSPQPRRESPADEWSRAIESILQTTQTTNGYALILGTQHGGLVAALASQSSLNIVALTTSEQVRDDLRSRLDAAGIPRARVAVHVGELQHFGLPPYLADLVVVDLNRAEDWEAAELDAGPDFIAALFERLRPYGGTACLGVAPDKDRDIAAWLNAAGHDEAQLQRVGDYLLITRAGALPGAVDYTGDWTAPDARVKAPLGILWYDDATPHFKRAPQPTVKGGIMISRDKQWLAEPVKMGPPTRIHIPGTGRFYLAEANFVDIYTGRVLAGDEATARLGTAAEPVADEARPPYQYRPPFIHEFFERHEAQGTKPAKWPFQRELDRGEMLNPITGEIEPRRYVKSYGCDGGNDYGQLLTMRSATPAFYDKRIESGTINISGPRSGCTNSIIPAGGVLNVPYFYDGCSCSYPLPTAAALVSMPQTYEQWTAWGGGAVGPIQRIGINLSAPGDRMTAAGTLWVDYPSVGGPSPEINVVTEPARPEFFYHHSLWTSGGRGWPWVCASGAENLATITVDGLKAGSYTVRLFFAEPDSAAPGQRVFDVAIQGNTVLAAFDVVAESGGRMKCLVKQFSDVAVSDTLTVNLTAQTGQTLLCGIEIVRSDLPLDALPTLP